jgi:hypothetical protein
LVQRFPVGKAFKLFRQRKATEALQAVIASEVEVIKLGGAAGGMRDGVAQKTHDWYATICAIKLLV